MSETTVDYITEPGFYDDTDERIYHAHPTSLSVSGAKTLLKSPALYRYRRDHPEHKDAWDVGTAFHTKTLGTGYPISVIDAASWQGKAAAEARDAARAEHRTPILTKDDEVTTGMAEAVWNSSAAMEWLQGTYEVSAFAPDPFTGIMRRSRFDVLGEAHIADLKSTRDADPAVFVKDVANFKYHMQAAWYLDLARSLGHPALGFAFIAVEKTPPFFVSVIELDEEALDLGRALNAKALATYARCIETDEWPGYTPSGYATVSLPRWAFKEDVA